MRAVASSSRRSELARRSAWVRPGRRPGVLTVLAGLPGGFGGTGQA
jgi:hypothetical protein